MRSPTEYKPLTITQPFKPGHNGVDLRNYTPRSGLGGLIITAEDCSVLRYGIDKFGNEFLVVKGKSGIEHKYIHNMIYPLYREKGVSIAEGVRIGVTTIGGNSKALHLHYETWRKGKPVDPVTIWDEYGVEYEEA